jgi:hypothetical protein
LILTTSMVTTASRFLAGVLVFALVGPPIGGMVAWLAMGAQSMRSPLPFITGSYLEGGALAAGAGLLTGLAALLGLCSWLVPVLMAVLINVILFAAVTGPEFSAPNYWEASLSVARVFLLPSVAAALICWALTRKLFRPD